MAVYVMEAFIECGSDKTAVEAIKQHFQGLMVRTRKGDSTHCVVWVYKDQEENWCCIAWPHGCGLGTPAGVRPELTDAEAVKDLQDALLAHLRKAPAFRFALVDGEVDDVRSFSELNEWDFQNLHGLIVSNELWEQFKMPANFEYFSPNCMWLPRKLI